MPDENENFVKGTLKDIVISLIIVGLIFLSLYAYAQTWPPIVVIESGSMQHGSLSHIGTIDTGDIVMVKKVYSPEDVVSYVEGRMNGYKTYGDYGDVIIYRCNGHLIIHRAIMYLHWNGHGWKIRGWNINDFKITFEVKKVKLHESKADVTLQVVYYGGNLKIKSSKMFFVTENGEIGSDNVLITSETNHTLSLESLIFIKNLPATQYKQSKIGVYDDFTKTKLYLDVEEILNPNNPTETLNNTISLTYPSWLHVTKNYITIDNAGYAKKEIVINLQNLNPNRVGKDGFITMGDHNLAQYGGSAYDQSSAGGFIPICSKLVNYNMIVGVAKGEIPWFGAIKLYITGTNTEEIPSNTVTDLVVSIVLLVIVSFGIDYTISHRDKIRDWLRRRSEK